MIELPRQMITFVGVVFLWEYDGDGLPWAQSALAMTGLFAQGTMQIGGGAGHPALRITRKSVQARLGPSGTPAPTKGEDVRYIRADMGSELSAARGRESEMRECPRSKFPASAVRQRGNFGHRNRDIRTPVLSPLWAREAFFAQKRGRLSASSFLHN